MQPECADGVQIDPQFVLYLAENLAVFDYQLQEEVMLVIQQLSQVVSDGAAVANAIELGQLPGAGNESLEGMPVTLSGVSCTVIRWYC